MSIKRIILVDDEPYVTTTLASKFRAAGFEVEVANNGEDGFELARTRPPDVVITDYQMPVLSGYEMSVKLRCDAATVDVPILMLTARGHHLSTDQLSKTNIKLMFAKPFSARELVNKVHELVGTSGQAQQSTSV